MSSLTGGRRQSRQLATKQWCNSQWQRLYLLSTSGAKLYLTYFVCINSQTTPRGRCYYCAYFTAEDTDIQRQVTSPQHNILGNWQNWWPGDPTVQGLFSATRLLSLSNEHTHGSEQCTLRWVVLARPQPLGSTRAQFTLTPFLQIFAPQSVV